jgi:RHS repeat-associated protein
MSTYTYLNIAGAPSNRLGHVDDLVNSATFTDDIDDQNPNNYSYDQLGQLIGDQLELIANIEWRSGDKKIKALTRTTTAGNKSDMEFVYNPLGQRVVKIEKTRLNNVLESNDKWKYTYYAYDANGQVMATYAVKLSTTVNRATLTEQHLYGASRLGMRRIDKRLYENGTSPNVIPDVQQNTLGNISYEITNYLGNVNVVISDRKIWNGTPINAFRAVILSKTDYFPFGQEISSRNVVVENYRYGYNGMESDDETKGSGNSYTTEFRQYDPRIGRWLSLDPLMAQFPWQSPYCAFDNNPVYFTDPTGLKAEDWVRGGKSADGKKTYDDNVWHWEESVTGKDQADALGANDWIPRSESRTITTIDDKKATLSFDNFNNRPQVEYENITENVESGISPFLWSQVRTPDFSGAITNPGAGVFMIGNDPFDRAALKNQWGSSKTWHQFNGYVNDMAWEALFFAGGEAIMCGFLAKPTKLIYNTAKEGGKAAAKGGLSNARALGIAGEEAVGVGAKTRIPSLTGTAKYRIPDQLTSTTLGEVKNVSHLSLTRQLTDFHLFSQQTGRQFILYKRPNTTFSGPLQNLINNGSIITKPIPFR